MRLTLLPYQCDFEINSIKDVITQKEKLDKVDKSIAMFLLDWYDDKSDIKVQTSGSTGMPKTISARKSAMLISAKLTCDYFELVPGDSALLCLPVQFIAGKMMLVRAMERNLHLYVTQPTGTPLINHTHLIDFAAVTPFQLENSLNHASNSIAKISTIIIGGGAIPKQLNERIKKTTVSPTCFATFGMTETLTHIAIKQLNRFPLKLRQPQSYFECLSGITVSQDERDCLVIQAAHLNDMPIITNDVVRILSDSRFEWMGRWDNIINSGGVKLNPEIIESKIAPFLPKHRFFIHKQKHSSLGEIPVIVIESNQPISLPTWDKVLDKYEIPKNIYYLKSFIETKTGKVKRFATLNKIRYI